MSAHLPVLAELKSTAVMDLIQLYVQAWRHETPDFASWMLPAVQCNPALAALLVLTDAQERADRAKPVEKTMYEAALGSLVHAPEIIEAMEILPTIKARPRRPDGSAPPTLDETQLLHAGVVLGDFELVGRLGRGSFGAVWHARDTRLACDVALKLIPASPNRRRRLESLLREASAASGIHHQNVVNVRGAGEFLEIDLLFISMQLCGDVVRSDDGTSRFCPGASLTEWGLTPERMPALSPYEAAALVASACRGVHEAHLRNVIHRDLKPANILVTPSGRPMVADFGLASTGLQSSTAGQFDPSRSVCVPVAGRTIVGTPDYMPPEQARGEAAAPASDVYTLGGVLYFLLTGAAPHAQSLRAIVDQKGNVDAVFSAIAQDRVEIPALPRRVPGALRRICLKALSRSPGDRYPSADAMADDLGAFLERTVPPGVGPDYPGQAAWLLCRRHPRAASASLAAGLAAGAGCLLYVANLTAAKSLADAERQDAVQWSYAANIGAADASIRLGQTAEARKHLERCPEEMRHIEWHFLHACLQDSSLVLTGHDGPVTTVALSPDGTLVASGGADKTVRLWDAASGSALAALPPGSAVIRELAFDPDGSSLWVVDNHGAGSRWDLSTPASPQQAETHEFIPGDKRTLSRALFSPDMSCLALRSDFIRVVKLDGELVWERPAPETGSLTGLAFSPDGKLLAFPVARRNPRDPSRNDWFIIIADAASGDQRAVIPATQSPPPSISFIQPNVITFPSYNGIEWAAIDSQDRGAVPTAWLGQPSHVAASPNHDFVISAGHSRRPQFVGIWDLTSEEPLALGRGHDSHIIDAAFDRVSGRFATAGFDRTVRLWPRPKAGIHQLDFSKAGTPAGVSSAGGVLSVSQATRLFVITSDMVAQALLDARQASSTADEFYFYWNGLGQGSERRIPYRDAAVAYDIDIAPGGAPFAMGYVPRRGRSLARVLLAPSPDSSRHIAFDAHAGLITCVSFSPDGLRLLTTAANDRPDVQSTSAPVDSPAAVWDARTGKLIVAAQTNERIFCGGRFAPDGASFITWCSQPVISRFDAASGQLLGQYQAPAEAELFIDVAESADGTRLAGVGFDGIWVWRLPDNLSPELFPTPTRSPRRVAYSPDSRRLFVAFEKCIEIWDAKTSERLITIDEDRGVRGASFDRYGRRLLADTSFTILDLPTCPDLSKLPIPAHEKTASPLLPR